MRPTKNLKSMPQNIILLISTFISLPFVICSSCNKQPFKPSYHTAVGYVIGKEICNHDTAKDYWLINIISSSSVQQQYGDTLSLNGITYTNVIKTIGIKNNFKIIGQKVGFDFTTSKDRDSTKGCILNPHQRHY